MHARRALTFVGARWRRRPLMQDTEAMTKPADRVEWLLRADETARAVPVSARMVMDDEFWRASIERFEPSDGLSIFLTSAEVHRDFVFDTHQAEPDPRLLGHIPVSGHAR